MFDERNEDLRNEDLYDGRYEDLKEKAEEIEEAYRDIMDGRMTVSDLREELEDRILASLIVYREGDDERTAEERAEADREEIKDLRDKLEHATGSELVRDILFGDERDDILYGLKDRDELISTLDEDMRDK